MSEAAHRTAGPDGPHANGVRGPLHDAVRSGPSIGYLIGSRQVIPLNTATNTTLRPIKLPTVIDWDDAVRR